MAELAVKLALTICIGCAVLLLVYLTRYLFRYFKFIEQRSRNAQKDLSFSNLDNLIRASAISSLKKNEDDRENTGNVFQSEREEMRAGILEDVRKIINPGKHKEIADYIADLDEWIINRIEYHLRNNRQ